MKTIVCLILEGITSFCGFRDVSGDCCTCYGQTRYQDKLFAYNDNKLNCLGKQRDYARLSHPENINTVYAKVYLKNIPLNPHTQL